jgi:hypothetical protein
MVRNYPTKELRSSAKASGRMAAPTADLIYPDFVIPEAVRSRYAPAGVTGWAVIAPGCHGNAMRNLRMIRTPWPGCLKELLQPELQEVNAA